MPLLTIEKAASRRLATAAAFASFCLAAAFVLLLWTEETRWRRVRKAEEISAVPERVAASLARIRGAVRDLLAGGDQVSAATERDSAHAAFQREVDRVRERLGGYPSLVEASVNIRNFVTGPLNTLHARYFVPNPSMLIESVAHDNLHYPELKAQQGKLLEDLSKEAQTAAQSELSAKRVIEITGLLGVLGCFVGFFVAAGAGARTLGKARRAAAAAADHGQLLQAIKALAAEGQSAAERLKASAHPVLSISSQTLDMLANLSSKVTRINTAANDLSKVAEQNNLLSLNAAIEAEKAGEFGLAFAVIAMEIRRLSDQTAETNADIAQTLEEIRVAIHSGLSDSGKTASEARAWEERLIKATSGFARIIEGIEAFERNLKADG